MAVLAAASEVSGPASDNIGVGFAIGLFLLILAPMLIFSAEIHAVRFMRLLKHARKMTIDVGIDKLRPRFSGHMVHVQGAVDLTANFVDDATGLHFPSALRIKRKVEMYQWAESETRSTSKKATTYEYETGWHENHIISDEFRHPEGHTNPKARLVPLQSESFDRADAMLGSFSLGKDAVERATWWTPCHLGSSIAQQLSPQLAAGSIEDGRIYLLSGGSRPSPGEPAIGDMRIAYESVELPHDRVCSIVGVQQGSELRPFTEAHAAKLVGKVLEERSEMRLEDFDGFANSMGECSICLTIFGPMMLSIILDDIGNDVLLVAPGGLTARELFSARVRTPDMPAAAASPVQYHYCCQDRHYRSSFHHSTNTPGSKA